MSSLKLKLELLKEISALEPFVKEKVESAHNNISGFSDNMPDFTDFGKDIEKFLMHMY